jgi:hypothetical protein
MSSNGIDIRDNTPPIEAPTHIKIPPFEEILPQEFPNNPTIPLIPDFSPSTGKYQFGRQCPKPLPKFPFSTPHLESKNSR